MNTLSKILKAIVLIFTSIQIQAQVGNVGINTLTPQAMLHVKDSSVLFSANFLLPTVPGNPPASGAGTRMMWYPDKAAFRAGTVSSTNWDKESIGLYSNSLGFNTKSTGSYSTAIGNNTIAAGNGSTALGKSTLASGNSATSMGENSIALGDYSTAMGKYPTASGNVSTAIGEDAVASGYCSIATGFYTKASGIVSTAIGYITKALGDYSTAMGCITTASGKISTAMGLNNIVKGYSSTVVGMYNDSILVNNEVVPSPTTPLFIVGNGDDLSTRSNALVVLKNGNTGLNTSAPQADLHVVRNASSAGPKNGNAITILESNQDSYLQFSNTATTESGILAGNNVTAIKSAIVFPTDSSIHLRAGGNSIKMVVDKTGNIGMGTSSPNSKLHVAGSISKAIQTTIGSITLDANDYTTIITPTANNVLVSLPAANTCAGREYVIVNKDGNNFNTNIAYLDFANVANTIIPATSSITLQSDGSNWHRIR
jgi:hypothetical protein